MLAYFTIYLIVSLLAGGLATILAHRKHRTWLLWGTLSIFFPPFVLILFFLPKRSGPAPYEKESDAWDGDDFERDDGRSFW